MSKSVNESNKIILFDKIFGIRAFGVIFYGCLLYTSDAADDSLRVDLGGRRIIKKIF